MIEHKYYYVLGEGTIPLEGHGFPWPYGVGYDPFDSERPFILWEGVAHGAVGGSFTAKQVLDDSFSDHRRASGTEWILPLLQRVAGGEQVSVEEILKAYRAHHGAEPARKDYSSSQ